MNRIPLICLLGACGSSAAVAAPSERSPVPAAEAVESAAPQADEAAGARHSFRTWNDAPGARLPVPEDQLQALEFDVDRAFTSHVRHNGAYVAVRLGRSLPEAPTGPTTVVLLDQDRLDDPEVERWLRDASARVPIGLVCTDCYRLPPFDLRMLETRDSDPSLRNLRSLRELYLSDSIDLADLQGLGELRVLVARSERTHGFDALRTLTGLRDLDLRGSPVSDVHLRAIAQLAALERLQISGSAITDGGVRALASLENLRAIGLRGTAIGARTIAWLAELERLQELDLSSTEIADADLQRLRGLRDLRRLVLSRTDSVHGDGLSVLAHFPRLEELELAHMQLDEHALAPLASATGLRSVNLRDTIVDLAPLGAHRGLVYLELAGYGRSPGSLADLGPMPELVHLGLGSVPVGDSELESLLEKTPNLASLELSGAHIESLAFLRHVPHLERLVLPRELPLDEEAIVEALQTLPRLHDYMGAGRTRFRALGERRSGFVRNVAGVAGERYRYR